MSSPIHTIRAAKGGDESSIMGFIGKYWSADHIFARNEKFFRYEFSNGEKLNFVIAVNNETSLLEGILGFIKYTDGYDNSDIFTVMWKVKEKTGDPCLGLKLMNFLKDNYKFRTISGVGANKATLPIYHYLGYKTDKLKHFYLLNPCMDVFRIAEINDRRTLSPRKGICSHHLHKIVNPTELSGSFDFEKHRKDLPFKDQKYVEKRYFNHPIYEYDSWGIKEGNEIKSLLITRCVEINSSKVLRIVDFIGDAGYLGHIGNGLLDLLRNGGCEYVDFYEYGIDEDLLASSGFVLKDENDRNIIPNYFEPFVRSNIDIHFFTNQYDNFHIFKGDGDQDRPNWVNS